MEFLIFSDAHGRNSGIRAALARQPRQPDGVIFLGDGLRQLDRAMFAPTPLFCVRGNCDCEVDQMVLDFPVLADYGFLLLEGRAAYLTHGHVINKAHPLPFQKGDILLHGHTHIPACEDCGDFTYLNPGSVSIPKNGSAHSYMIYENGAFVWKELLTGEEYQRFSL